MSLKKFYTANLYSDGKIAGSIAYWVWLWESPVSAHDQIIDSCKPFVIGDFRRV